MSGCCCTPKSKLILDPALLEEIGACCSSYVATDNPDGSTTLVLDPGDGTPAITVTIPAAAGDGGAGGPGAVSAYEVVTNPDGSQTVTLTPGDGTTPTVLTIPAGGEDACPCPVYIDENGEEQPFETAEDGAPIIPVPEECVFQSVLCGPDGEVVLANVAEDGAATFTNADGSPFTGDTAALEDNGGTLNPGGSGSSGAGGTTSTVTDNGDGTCLLYTSPSPRDRG